MSIEITDVGPRDKNGEQTFTASWPVLWSMSKPWPHTRAQVFHTKLIAFIMRKQMEGETVECEQATE